MNEALRIFEKATLGQGPKDQVAWKPIWTISKYVDEAAYHRGEVDAVEVIEGNLALNEGINALWNILCGNGSNNLFDATNAHIGVGDSSTAAAAAQTGLQASTNKLYKGMDETFPTSGTNQKATWQSTFTGAEANFAWNELSLANGDSDAADNLNRIAQVMGVKVLPAVWTVTLEITLA